MKKIIRVEPLSDKKIAVSFLDGKSGVFDVTPYIRGEFFRQLEDEEYFKKVRLFLTASAGPTVKIFKKVPGSFWQLNAPRRL